MNNIKGIITWLFRVVLIFLIVYFYRLNQSSITLFANSSPQSFEVVDKQCKRSRGGSFVRIRHKGKEHKVEYYGDKCFEAKIGVTVDLYYDENNDRFYVPNSTVYERYVYGCILVFILSFIPWGRIGSRG